MRIKRLVVAGLLVVGLTGVRHEDASAAQCPMECRREINTVMCREEEYSIDGRVTYARYYFSYGF